MYMFPKYFQRKVLNVHDISLVFNEASQMNNFNNLHLMLSHVQMNTVRHPNVAVIGLGTCEHHICTFTFKFTSFDFHV